MPKKKQKSILYTVTSQIGVNKFQNGKVKNHSLMFEITSAKRKHLEDILPWFEEYAKNIPYIMKQAVKNIQKEKKK